MVIRGIRALELIRNNNYHEYDWGGGGYNIRVIRVVRGI